MASEVHNFPYIEKIGGREDGDYLTRIHLTPFKWWPWKRFYLHIFSRPDKDRELHDHPWNFTTIVLFGGYDEISHKLDDRGHPVVIQKGQSLGPLSPLFHPMPVIFPDRLGFLSVRHRPATHAHKITRLHTRRVVTLVIRDNSRSREWGFWCGAQDVETGELSYHWRKWTDYLNLPPRTYEAY